MLDRQKIETILTRRFPGATHGQLAAAANAIMGLGEDWEDVSMPAAETGDSIEHTCVTGCWLEREARQGSEFRLLRRREH